MNLSWSIYFLSLATVTLGNISPNAQADQEEVKLSLSGIPETHSHTALKSILKNTHRASSYGYPTDLTRNILPIPVHSHNDYWRDVPFFSGLSAGAISTEADIWLYDGSLYVGHDESSLTEARTLDSLYIKPILGVLKRQNPKSHFVDGDTKNGVFDANRRQTLYFFIDIKTDGHETLQHAISALKPLSDAGYLTTLRDNKTLVPGPVTVIFTGNTQLHDIVSTGDRNYFFDGPLAGLQDTEITHTVSPIASTDFGAAFGPVTMGDGQNDVPFNSTQMKVLREQIRIARERGIGARYWGAPEWPIRLRNQIWTTLVREGVALLNTDDLKGVGNLF